ncbi:hypothetical protein D7X48_01830 [bacterium D16-50]|nr:hypothetical protein D7X48_01830 [bacterium D16-50]
MAGKREEQLKEITERLEQGVKDLFTSEKYTEYLKTMSQFHNYSFNNTLLIAMQKPESTLVAGYSSWSKKFHRQVKRGEKGIKIIAPAPIREKEEIEKFDPETNEPVLRPDGQPETEEVEHIIPRFRVATVFDISQTYGDPLPELDTPELMGSVENFGIFMEAIGIVSPAPMRYAEIEGDAKGYYSNTNKEIVIREGMSEKQTMKTAVHEVTHAMCHDRDVMEELGEKKNQMTREVEAESVAFTVCSYFGLDTSDYSFPYIAGWSSDMDMKELRTSMDFIRKTAGSFIDSMVENIQKLQKEKAAQRELAEDDLVFQVAPLGEDTKKFYLVDNVGRVDFLRLLHTFAEQEKGNGNPEQFLKSHGVHLDLWRDSESLEENQEMPEFYDVLYMDADHIVDAAGFSTLIQVEMMISRAEYGQNAEGGKAEREYQYFQDIDTAVTAYHQIPNHMDKRLGMESTEQPPSRMSLIECRNGIETLTDIEKYSLSGKWVREETMEASQKAKEYLDGCNSEIAYQTGRGYFSIQTVSDGYDYTIYGKDFREIDGGVYDNPDITIGEAMEAILSDEGIQVALCKVMNYEELQEKAEAAAQEDIQKAQAEEKGKLSLISDMTEPEPALNGQSRAGIEETVLCYAQAQIDEMGLSEEVELLGARVYGSRSREGLYHEGSDIDVVVSYSGSLREDAFFNALHKDGLEIAGIPVDINPISTEKTGTLEEYLENAEKYLDEKQSRMELPEYEQGGQTGQEAVITFYVAECTEFPVLGEYHERLETLQEAMELYEKIPAERMNGMKGIGFRLEDGSIYDGNFDLMVMGEMQTEFINEIPQYRESPLVQKAISDMEEILSKQKERDVSEPDKKQELSQPPMSSGNKEKAVQMYEEEKSDPTTYEAGRDTGTVETKAAKPEKSAENAPKADKGISGGSRKQSVLNALRERQARMKAQEKEKQGQEKTARKKGGQEL